MNQYRVQDAGRGELLIVTTEELHEDWQCAEVSARCYTAPELVDTAEDGAVHYLPVTLELDEAFVDATGWLVALYVVRTADGMAVDRFETVTEAVAA